MEHRLITGGAQYLPFARSRIKAMRATGLDWATERYNFGDGEVEVRLEGEIDYIKLSGGGCEMPMDSGVVDLNSIVFTNPAGYVPGTLHRSDAVENYTEEYGEPDGRIPGNLKNTGDGSAGQIAGTVRYAGGFRGSIPPADAPAPSFTGRRALPGEDAQPDENLANKKRVAASYPASMLTGRARLYLQALYGLPMYDYAFNEDGEPTSVRKEYLQVATDGNGVVVPTADRTATITLNVDSGIYLDPATGKHYLILPDPVTTRIFPLKSSTCGESMRKLLAGKDPSPNDPLTDLDRHHIETYILSQSLPDATKMTTAGSSRTGDASFSFGYGWKWNWNGTQADRIVWDGTIGQSRTHALVTTSHWQFILTHKGDGEFTTACGSVEGPATWGLPINMFNVVYPNWAFGQLQKFLDYPAFLGNFDAPIYCFYRKNELQVVRVTCSQRTLEDEWFWTPHYFQNRDNWKAGGTFDKTCITLGLGGGNSYHVDGGPPFFDIRFNVNGTEYGPMPYGKSQVGIYNEVGAKALTGAEDDSTSGPYNLNNDTETTDLNSGPVDMSNYPGSIGPPAQVTVRGPGEYYTDIFLQASYRVKQTVLTKRADVWGFVVIPFFDAEAAYILCHHDEVDAHTGVHDATQTAYPFVSRSTGPGAATTAYWAIAQDPPTTSPADDFNVVRPQLSKKDLHCARGTVEALDFPMNDAFWNTEAPFIPDTFATLGSAHPLNPVALARTKIDPAGIDEDPDHPVIVGWA